MIFVFVFGRYSQTEYYSYSTVSQEQFWPITKLTQNFILDNILRYPYKSKYDSPQNICLGLFEFSPPPWGGNHISLTNVYQTFIVGSFILISIPQLPLFKAYITSFDHWLPEYASAHSRWEGEMMKPSGVLVGVGGVLGVKVSYKITRGIKLVEGRVND